MFLHMCWASITETNHAEVIDTASKADSRLKHGLYESSILFVFVSHVPYSHLSVQVIKHESYKESSMYSLLHLVNINTEYYTMLFRILFPLENPSYKIIMNAINNYGYFYYKKLKRNFRKNKDIMDREGGIRSNFLMT